MAEEDSTTSQTQSGEQKPTSPDTLDSVQTTKEPEGDRYVELQNRPAQASPAAPETSLEVDAREQSLPESPHREELDSVQTANLEGKTQDTTKRQAESSYDPVAKTQTTPDSPLQDKPSPDQDQSTKSLEDDKDKEKETSKEASSPEPEKAKGILGVLQGPYGKLAIAAVAMLVGGPVVAAATYFALTQAEKMTKKTEDKSSEQGKMSFKSIVNGRNAFIAATGATLVAAPPIGITMAAAGGMYVGAKAAAPYVAKGAKMAAGYVGKKTFAAGAYLAGKSMQAYAGTKKTFANLFSKKQVDVDSVQSSEESVGGRDSQTLVASTPEPESPVASESASTKPDYSNEEALSGAASMFEQAKREVSEAASTKPDYSNEEALSGASDMFEGAKKKAEKTPTVESPVASVREGDKAIELREGLADGVSQTAAGVSSEMDVGMQTRTDGKGSIKQTVGEKPEEPAPEPKEKEVGKKRLSDSVQTEEPVAKKPRYSESTLRLVDSFREITPVSPMPPGNNLSPSTFKTALLDMAKSQDSLFR